MKYSAQRAKKYRVKGAERSHPKGANFSCPEDMGHFCDCTAVPFLQRHCNCAFGDHIFSLLREKIWKKRTLENEIALTRGKAFSYIVRVIVTPAVKERPSGGAFNFVYGNIAPR